MLISSQKRYTITMSKTTLKKTLRELTRDQIIDVVLELYDARRDAREYLEYFVNPDEAGMAEKARAIIAKEFFPPRGRAKGRSLICRRAIKDYTLLHPSPRHIAAVNLYLVECVITYAVAKRWWITETQEKLLHSALIEAVDYCISHDLYEDMHSRIAAIIHTLAASRALVAREAMTLYRSFCEENGIFSEQSQ